tara:strand:- start:139 stop:1872 length:1734 start_codon:yes stop_codon:yes gene_type:complete
MALETNLESNKSTKEFENLLKEDFKKRDLKEGAIIKATVSEIGKKYVFVDLNAKSEGIIPIEEFKITKEFDTLKVGSKIEVYLERIEGFKGDIVVSREKARRFNSWERMSRAFDKQEEVEGQITSRVKGGMIASIDSCLCFLPGSQIDTKPLKSSEIDELMNVPLKFLCVKMDKVRGNIVVSRRAVLEKTKNQDLKKVLSKIKEGDIIKSARVKAVESFGAFIDIGDDTTGPVDSLLHQSDISYNRVKKVSDLLSVGDQITVKVIKLDRDTNRISVGIKQLGPDPWENLDKQFSVGQTITGTVSKIVEFGVFVQISENLQGLCHTSELDYLNRNANPSKILSPSQKVKFKIIELDVSKRRMSLSYKACLPNPWDTLLKKYPVNSIVTATAANTVDFGIFANIEDTNLKALLHKNDMSYNPKEDDIKKYKKNTKFKAKVVEIDKDKEKIRISVRALERDPFDYFKNKKNGEVITVKVQSVLKNAIKVSPGNEDKLEIIIKKNQLGKDGRVDVYSIGNRIDCMVTDLDMDKRKVNLSIKELEIQNEKRDIQKFGKAGSKSGAVLGDILGKVFSSKKKKK